MHKINFQKIYFSYLMVRAPSKAKERLLLKKINLFLFCSYAALYMGGPGQGKMQHNIGETDHILG